MSTYYSIYTEINVDGKWELADGLYKNHKTKELEIAPAYENGSRSAFGETYYKMLEFPGTKGIKIDELSDDLKEQFQRWVSGFGSDPADSYFEQCLYQLDFQDIVDHSDDKTFTHHGYVHKDTIQAFEIGDCDYIFSAEEDEESGFFNLTLEERSKVYEYTEWDNYDDPLYNLKEVRRGVTKHVNDYKSVNYLYSSNQVRLIMYVS